jgi:hypothetical protein
MGLGVWKMIRPWLDPVIASKINFTSSNADLARFITQDSLQKCYDGKDAWEYRYVAPVEGENDKMQSEKKEDVEAERTQIIRQFEELSVEWAQTEPTSADAKQKGIERCELAERLAKDYWKLDPFIRARTYYHRVGVIDPDGAVDYKAAP